MRHVAVHALDQRNEIRPAKAAERAEMRRAVLDVRADYEATVRAMIRVEGSDSSEEGSACEYARGGDVGCVTS